MCHNLRLTRLTAAALLVLAALTACEGRGAQPYAAQPYQPVQAAEQPGLAALDVAVGLTAQAAERQQGAIWAQVAQATADAASTQGAYALEATRQHDALQLAIAQQGATATAQQLTTLATQGAELAVANATATAEFRQAALEARATSQASEQLAAERQVRQLEREERQADFYAVLTPILVTVASLLVVGMAAFAGFAWVTTRANRNSVIETRYGPVVLADQLGRLAPRVIAGELGNSMAMLPAPDDDGDEFASDVPAAPSIVYNVGGRPAGHLRPVDDPQRRLVLSLLRSAMLQVGPSARRVPGWRDLGMHPQRWSDAVAALRPHVRATPGRGTFVTQGTLHDLYAAVGARHVQLSPLASPAPRRAGVLTAQNSTP